MDAFSAVNGDTWSRLHQLAFKRRLSGAEADELLRLYQLTSVAPLPHQVHCPGKRAVGVPLSNPCPVQDAVYRSSFEFHG